MGEDAQVKNSTHSPPTKEVDKVTDTLVSAIAAFDESYLVRGRGSIGVLHGDADGDSIVRDNDDSHKEGKLSLLSEDNLQLWNRSNDQVAEINKKDDRIRIWVTSVSLSSMRGDSNNKDEYDKDSCEETSDPCSLKLREIQFGSNDNNITPSPSSRPFSAPHHTDNDENKQLHRPLAGHYVANDARDAGQRNANFSGLLGKSYSFVARNARFNGTIDPTNGSNNNQYRANIKSLTPGFAQTPYLHCGVITPFKSHATSEACNYFKPAMGIKMSPKFSKASLTSVRSGMARGQCGFHHTMDNCRQISPVDKNKAGAKPFQEQQTSSDNAKTNLYCQHLRKSAASYKDTRRWNSASSAYITAQRRDLFAKQNMDNKLIAVTNQHGLYRLLKSATPNKCGHHLTSTMLCEEMCKNQPIAADRGRCSSMAMSHQATIDGDKRKTKTCNVNHCAQLKNRKCLEQDFYNLKSELNQRITHENFLR